MRCPSEWDHLVLDRLSSFEPIDGAESGHLRVERHSAQAVQLAHESERDRMVDEVVAAGTALLMGRRTPLKAAVNGLGAIARRFEYNALVV
jgi:O-acetylhomoserine/O-acetylserine sulfhydrylase-like pyridoxal-dependent enzyme